MATILEGKTGAASFSPLSGQANAEKSACLRSAAARPRLRAGLDDLAHAGQIGRRAGVRLLCGGEVNHLVFNQHAHTSLPVSLKGQ